VQNELTLRQIVDGISAPLAVMTPDGALEIVNRPILEYFGKTAEELKEWTSTDAVHPDDLPRVLSAWRQSIESGQAFTDEHRQRRSDGAYRWFHVQGLPIRDAESRIVRWCVLQTDIDERKRAEQALRESERELRQLVDSVPGMIAVGDSMGKLQYANKRFLDFLGMTTDELAASFVEPIHPDERETMQNEWLRSSAIGQAVEVVQRLRRFDGVYRWIHVRVDPLRDEGGRIVRWYGLHTDIDDQRRAEERVRQSERELRQILDLTPQHITEFGPDGSRLYNNRAALDYHGLTLEEWQSAASHTLLHPEDAERVMREQPVNFQRGSAFETEMRLRKRDGQCRWFLVRFRPMLDEQGTLTRWYAAATDIDDRKQAEQRLHNENVALREEIDSASMFEEIVGTSASLQTVLSRVSKVAPSDSSVLITGETGTGKELVARAIHRRSRRSSRAFVSVNCGAIPRDLIPSELFGHEKGAFTGATQRRLGRFELAEGGTIFLDEIGELPAETQIALLRVLQEHEFERLGSGGSIRTNVRVIAATNRDLEAAVAAGTFRSDLFYRLNVFPIEVPSLRQRREDIPLLVEYFIDRYARKARKSFQTVHKESLDLLQSYSWPGNIRELQNVIERSVIVCETGTFAVDESWLSRRPVATEQSSQPDVLKRPAAQEKAIIETALRESSGRVYGPSGAAAKLGIARSTLESKIKLLKINKNRFRPA
jgi:formate hydrogenlyase transcriptional activator